MGCHTAAPGPRGILSGPGRERGQAPSRPEGSCPQPGEGARRGGVRDGFLCEKEQPQEGSLEEVQVQKQGACPGPPQPPTMSLPLSLPHAPHHFPTSLIDP